MAMQPCSCPCKACGGFVTPKEQRASIARCLTCRKFPTPTCKRIMRYFDPRPRPSAQRKAIVNRAQLFSTLPLAGPEAKRIDALIARNAVIRRYERRLAQLQADRTR